MKAFCPKCDIIYDVRLFSGSNINVTVSNVNVSGGISCPKCYGAGKVLDGTYHYDAHGVATLLSSPQFTIDTLNKLKEVAQKAKAENYTPERFLKETKEISPETGDFFEKGFSKGVIDIIALLAFLVPLIISIIALKKKEQPIINVTNNYYNVPNKPLNSNRTPPKKKRNKNR